MQQSEQKKARFIHTFEVVHTITYRVEVPSELGEIDYFDVWDHLSDKTDDGTWQEYEHWIDEERVEVEQHLYCEESLDDE